jgi:hypothetical protein
MSPDHAGLLPGTLDLLILKAVSLGKLHGYGVLLRIGQISGGALQIQQGALYPAAGSGTSTSRSGTRHGTTRSRDRGTRSSASSGTWACRPGRTIRRSLASITR